MIRRRSSAPWPSPVERQGPVFKPERVLQTTGEGRNGDSQTELVGRGDLSVAVPVGPFVVADTFGPFLGQA